MRAPAAIYPRRRGARPSAPVAAGVVVGVAVIVGIIWAIMGKPRGSGVPSAPAGPPCAVVSHADVAPRLQPPRVSNVGGVLFARAAGDVYCDVHGDLSQEALGGGDTVSCQFSAPGALSVQTKRGEVDFAVPAGQVATVIVAKGQPRCVLAAPYWTSLSQSLAKDIRAQ